MAGSDSGKQADVRQFSATLQKEIEDETSVKFGVLNLSLFSGMVYKKKHQEARTVTAEQARQVVEAAHSRFEAIIASADRKRPVRDASRDVTV